MDQNYIATYKKLYDHHWWWRSREAAVLSVISRHHQAHRGDRVLDIGCGDGLFFEELSKFGEVSGVEVDPQAVSTDGKYRAQIHVGPFDDSFQSPIRFQLITMLDVLEHLVDPSAAARKIAGMLTREGACIITVPAFLSLWTGHDTMNQHVTRYTVKRLREVLEPAGLQVVEARYLFHWLAVAKLIVRLKESVFGEETTPPRVPSRPINRLLQTISSIDLRKGRGWGLPFGSSIIAVVRTQG